MVSRMGECDSCWGLTENRKFLKSNYPSIKNKLIKKRMGEWYNLTNGERTVASWATMATCGNSEKN